MLAAFHLQCALGMSCAGFRPRFGAGPKTAAIAAGKVFVLAELIPALFWITSGAYGFGEYLPFLISTLVVLVVAGVVGAWPYSEAEGAEAT